MDTQFYPMSKRPEHSDDEYLFSKTVMVYDEGSDTDKFSELGYFDFENDEWIHFGDNSMKLICWCEIPDPADYIKNNNLKSVTHRGYRP